MIFDYYVMKYYEPFTVSELKFDIITENVPYYFRVNNKKDGYSRVVPITYYTDNEELYATTDNFSSTPVKFGVFDGVMTYDSKKATKLKFDASKFVDMQIQATGTTIAGGDVFALHTKCILQYLGVVNVFCSLQ